MRSSSLAPSLRDDLAALPRKSPARANLRGEGARNFLADVELGPVIARCFALAGLNNDQAADAMGYTSSSSVSRWIANQEPPNLTRLWAVEALRACLVAALAERVGHAVEVETNIRIRTRRSA